MALLQISLFSNSLRRTVPVSVLLPADTPTPDGGGKYKTLYLLHGYMCNYTDWLCGASVSQLAQAHNLAVVMPSGDNSFYCDYAGSGIDYGKYIGQELVWLTRRLLPCLSDAREDTLIGGLSMGGFGALCCGLQYSETFGHIIALSSGMIVQNVRDVQQGVNVTDRDTRFYESILGDLDDIENSAASPAWLAGQLLRSGRPLPDLYFACGYNDRLVYHNRELRDQLRAMEFPCTYEEGPGSHEWAFWDHFLARGLNHALGRAPDWQNPYWVDAGPEQA